MSEPLRILLLGFNMPWRGGGTFYRAFGFATELAGRGHDVTVLMTSLEERWKVTEEMVDGVRLVQSPALIRGKLRTGWDPWEVVQRCRWLRRRRFDIVHGFECRPVVIFPALYAKRRHRARLVLDWCDWMGRGGLVEERTSFRSLQRTVETFFEERFRHRADATTVINEPLRQRATELGIAANTIHLLRNGAAIDTIRVLDRAQARNALGLDPNVRLIGHLGQTGRRDIELMASAFLRVKDAVPSSQLVVIGNYKEDIVDHLPTVEDVLGTGYVQGETLNQYLAACDVVWLPLADSLANHGRWPMKLSDYMASGRAVVSTRVGDWTELFRGPRPIGVLASADASDFAEKTISLLRDDTTREFHEENARRAAEEHFAWPLVTDRLEAIYTDLAH